MSRSTLVAVAVLSLASVLLMGCGGERGDEGLMATAATSPYAGLYLGLWGAGGTNYGCTVLRVNAAPGLTAMETPLHHCGVASYCDLTAAGGASWTETEGITLSSVTRSFRGTFAGSGASRAGGGTWSEDHASGEWSASLFPAIPRYAGSWPLQTATGAVQMPWSRACGFLYRAGATEYLTMIFDGSKTSLPYEVAVVIKNPRQVPLNSPTGVHMDLRLSDKPSGFRSDAHEYWEDDQLLPKLTFSSRNLGSTGQVSGTISGQLWLGLRYPVTLDKVPFTRVKMVATPPPPPASPPQGLSLEANGGVLTVRWSAPATTLPILRYQLERSIDGQAFTRIDANAVAAGATSFNDFGLAPGRHTYQYRLRIAYTNGLLSPYAVSGTMVVTQ